MKVAVNVLPVLLGLVGVSLALPTSQFKKSVDVFPEQYQRDFQQSGKFQVGRFPNVYNEYVGKSDMNKSGPMVNRGQEPMENMNMNMNMVGPMNPVGYKHPSPHYRTQPAYPLTQQMTPYAVPELGPQMMNMQMLPPMYYGF